MIPVLVWNTLFTGSLPADYSSKSRWDNIPLPIAVCENVLRTVVFLMPLFMPLSLHSDFQKVGLAVYVPGVLLYFTSWLLQMKYPTSTWSKSAVGFMAPAYTCIFLLIGIGMMGEKLFVAIPYHFAIYLALSTAFAFVHSWHAYLVFAGRNAQG